MKVNMINATTNVIQSVKAILKSIKVLFNKILNLHQWLVWCGITWIIWNLYTFQMKDNLEDMGAREENHLKMENEEEKKSIDTEEDLENIEETFEMEDNFAGFISSGKPQH